MMRSIRSRLRKLETQLTDASGLVPDSPKWLKYWDRRIYEILTSPKNERHEKIPLGAFRAVYNNAEYDPSAWVHQIPVPEEKD